MKIRFSEHRSNIRTYIEKHEAENKKDQRSKYCESTVAKHFFKMRHNISDLKWSILEKVYGNDEMQVRTRLLQREVYWIGKLDIKTPNGSNENFNFRVFL